MSNATGYEVRAKNAAAVKNGSYAFHTGLSCWWVREREREREGRERERDRERQRQRQRERQRETERERERGKGERHLIKP